MRRYIEVVVNHKPFVESLDDVVVELKSTKNKTEYSLDYDKTIVLDENGKEYVLTFCCVDYGGGGPDDCVDEYAFIFKVNEWQLEILKLLTGDLGRGVEYPNYFNYYPKEKHTKKNEVFKKLEYTLVQLGNLEDILDKMDIKEDTLYSTTYGFLNEIV